jgi:hemoglobin
MKDIHAAEDIKLLIDEFYKKVINDKSIGYFFTEVVLLSWEKHIPIMNSFWNSVLLGSNTYKGNPMIKHIELDHKSKLEPEHFEIWLKLWEKTIRELFRGPKAEEALLRAKNIALLMQHKIEINRS